MADSFKIKYAASATPIESVMAADTTTHVSLVHSNIDKTIGGGAEFACGATSTNVKYADYTTTVDDTKDMDDAVAGTNTGIDFIMVKIRENGDASTVTPDCTIEINSVIASKLIGVGDVCLLRPSGVALADIEIFSSGSTALAKVDILVGKD